VSNPMVIARTDSVVRPSASVVVCAHTLDRWVDLMVGAEAVRDQLAIDDELLVVVDHNEDLLRRAEAALPWARVLANRGRRGLSGGRNTGIGVARGEVVVFLDDDARPEPGWLDGMLSPYADSAVVGVGGAARPSWPRSGRPSWFPPEFDWVVGCSYTGLPTRPACVRNPIGATMSFRRAAFLRIGGFTDEIGRTAGARLVSCDETELSIRLRQRDPATVVIYQPEAVVRHRVPPERISFLYFRRRCYAEGFSKAIVARRVGRPAALSAETHYVRSTLSRAVWRDLRDPGRRRAALAAVAGLGVTGLGYLHGSLVREPQAGR
jgi:glucosyl-dolichyl phosphate glucuronosyltransferase